MSHASRVILLLYKIHTAGEGEGNGLVTITIMGTDTHLDELCTSDVLRHTLLPKLALADLLCLEQSCRAFRTTLSREEPWRRPLATCLPPDRPLPALSASQRSAAHNYAVLRKAYGAGHAPVTYASKRF